MIVSNKDTCQDPRKDAIGIIRSDFTICSNPANSLDNSCIRGSDNEVDNCGFSKNLLGLCLYCADNSPNSTDTCCYSSSAQSRCAGLVLPTFSNLPPIITATSSSSPSATGNPGAAGEGGSGLSGGAIAGITVGTLAAVSLIIFALFFCWRQRRRYGNQTSIFNHPTRSPPSMTFTTVGPVQSGRGYENISGARVARMSALEETSQQSGTSPSPPPAPAALASSSQPKKQQQQQQQSSSPVARQVVGDKSPASSSDFGLDDSPTSRSRKKHSPRQRPLNPPPRGRNASLSSSSVLGSTNSDPVSPVASSEKDGSAREFSSPPQSEQLPYFKDYYSSDDIHPGDKVSTLWAYSPRAPDEFELVRGDMLKVVGIWDDGKLLILFSIRPTRHTFPSPLTLPSPLTHSLPLSHPLPPSHPTSRPRSLVLRS